MIAVSLSGASLLGVGCPADDTDLQTNPTESQTSSAATMAAASDESTATSTGAGPTTTTGDPAECTALYGRPTPSTGLTADQCGPACPCLGGWVAPTYTDADVAALRAFEIDTPFPELTEDPYETPEAFPLDASSVCGVMVTGQTYAVATYDDEALAAEAGAKVTHDGACGRCSTLQDLAVYMGNGDLTEPVRACGVMALTQGEEANLDCLLDLGFTLPCAQIWLYNTSHTRTECLDECLAALDEPYHLPDGSLNPCLTCDEEKSGPVFKAVAGRTRRNTGLASALCRPCEQVRRVEHRYGDG